LFFLTIVGFGLRAQRRKVSTGIDSLVGQIGQAITDLSPAGDVWINGERWQAISTEGFVTKGQKVNIIAVSGLKLSVKPVHPISSSVSS
jgi:membrane-bound serine protease (ClpP class)